MVSRYPACVRDFGVRKLGHEGALTFVAKPSAVSNVFKTLFYAAFFLFASVVNLCYDFFMKTPMIIQFYIHAAEEGGYTAEAVEYSIHTEGDTLDETVHNIQEAVECHFGEDEAKRSSFPIMVNFALPATV